MAAVEEIDLFVLFNAKLSSFQLVFISASTWGRGLCRGCRRRTCCLKHDLLGKNATTFVREGWMVFLHVLLLGPCGRGLLLAGPVGEHLGVCGQALSRGLACLLPLTSQHDGVVRVLS